jgi:uncharacterized membrane protein
MGWKTTNGLGGFELRESIEIDADVGSTFAGWSHFEDFPRFLHSIRRTRRIDAQRFLWDIDIAGHQVVWDARIVERVPAKLVRWQSSDDAPDRGEIQFQALEPGRSRLTVEIAFWPRRMLARLFAHLGLVDRIVHRELERFRDFVERVRPGEVERVRPGEIGSGEIGAGSRPA